MGVSTSTMIVVDGSAGRAESMLDLFSCVIPCVGEVVCLLPPVCPHSHHVVRSPIACMLLLLQTIGQFVLFAGNMRCEKSEVREGTNEMFSRWHLYKVESRR